MKKVICLLLLALLLTGCGKTPEAPVAPPPGLVLTPEQTGTAPPPPPEDVTIGEATLETLPPETVPGGSELETVPVTQPPEQPEEPKPLPSLYETPEGLSVRQVLVWNALCYFRISDFGWPDARAAKAAEFDLEDPQLGRLHLLLVLTEDAAGTGLDSPIAIDMTTGLIYNQGNFVWPQGEPTTREETVTLIANSFDFLVEGAPLWNELETLELLTAQEITAINKELR